jgi:hypothetical protein
MRADLTQRLTKLAIITPSMDPQAATPDVQMQLAQQALQAQQQGGGQPPPGGAPPPGMDPNAMAGGGGAPPVDPATGQPMPPPPPPPDAIACSVADPNSQQGAECAIKMQAQQQQAAQAQGAALPPGAQPPTGPPQAGGMKMAALRAAMDDWGSSAKQADPGLTPLRDPALSPRRENLASRWGQKTGASKQAAPRPLHRALRPDEEEAIERAQSRIFPTIFQGYGTPLPEMMSSPGWAGAGGAGLGGLLGGGLGLAATGGNPIAGAAMGLGGAGLGGLVSYHARNAQNQGLTDLMKRMPAGATKRDYIADPAVSGDLNRQAWTGIGTNIGGGLAVRGSEDKWASVGQSTHPSTYHQATNNLPRLPKFANVMGVAATRPGATMQQVAMQPRLGPAAVASNQNLLAPRVPPTAVPRMGMRPGAPGMPVPGAGAIKPGPSMISGGLANLNGPRATGLGVTKSSALAKRAQGDPQGYPMEALQALSEGIGRLGEYAGGGVPGWAGPAALGAAGLGAGALGGLAGTGAGGLGGSLVGAGRGNVSEGLGRGMIRGGLTGSGIGLGAGLGAAAGNALGGGVGGTLAGGALGAGLGGLGGWGLASHTMGEPVGAGTPDRKKRQKKAGIEDAPFGWKVSPDGTTRTPYYPPDYHGDDPSQSFANFGAFGIPGLALAGGALGGTAGGLLGLGRGNAPEGLGRGVIRGSATGLGAGLGGLAGALGGRALSGLTSAIPTNAATTLGSTLGAGLGGYGGWRLSGGMLGEPAGKGKKKSREKRGLFGYGKPMHTVTKDKHKDEYYPMIMPSPRQPEHIGHVNLNPMRIDEYRTQPNLWNRMTEPLYLPKSFRVALDASRQQAQQGDKDHKPHKKSAAQLVPLRARLIKLAWLSKLAGPMEDDEDRPMGMPLNPEPGDVAMPPAPNQHDGDGGGDGGDNAPSPEDVNLRDATSAAVSCASCVNFTGQDCQLLQTPVAPTQMCDAFAPSPQLSGIDTKAVMAAPMAEKGAGMYSSPIGGRVYEKRSQIGVSDRAKLPDDTPAPAAGGAIATGDLNPAPTGGSPGAAMTSSITTPGPASPPWWDQAKTMGQGAWNKVQGWGQGAMQDIKNWPLPYAVGAGLGALGAGGYGLYSYLNQETPEQERKRKLLERRRRLAEIIEAEATGKEAMVKESVNPAQFYRVMKLIEHLGRLPHKVGKPSKPHKPMTKKGAISLPLAAGLMAGPMIGGGAGRLVGGTLGSTMAPHGKKREGLGRGILVGSNVGTLGAAGGLMGGLAGDRLSEYLPERLRGLAVPVGAGLGALGGGAGGYGLGNWMLGKPSWEWSDKDDDKSESDGRTKQGRVKTAMGTLPLIGATTLGGAAIGAPLGALMAGKGHRWEGAGRGLGTGMMTGMMGGSLASLGGIGGRVLADEPQSPDIFGVSGPGQIAGLALGGGLGGLAGYGEAQRLHEEAAQEKQRKQHHEGHEKESHYPGCKKSRKHQGKQRATSRRRMRRKHAEAYLPWVLAGIVKRAAALKCGCGCSTCAACGTGPKQKVRVIHGPEVRTNRGQYAWKGKGADSVKDDPMYDHFGTKAGALGHQAASLALSSPAGR